MPRQSVRFALALLAVPALAAEADSPAGSVKSCAGRPPEKVESSSHGSANPLVESANPHEPGNRRVEITIR